jgi:hypothetical protein
VIAREIPDDPDRPEVVFAAQEEDLVDDLRRCLVGRVFWDGLGIDEPGFASLLRNSIMPFNYPNKFERLAKN